MTLVGSVVTAVHANGYKNKTNFSKIELTFRVFFHKKNLCSCLEQSKALTGKNVTYVREHSHMTSDV